MPYEPRQTAPTTGAQPWLHTKGRENSPPAVNKPAEPPDNPRQSLQMERLNLRKFDVPVADVYKALFGRDAEVDGRTGQLVHPSPPPPLPPLPDPKPA